MAIRASLLRLLSVLLLARAATAAGGAAASEFDDGTSPKFLGCDNTLQKVKVTYWVGGDEQSSLTGISARFGAELPDTAGQKKPAVQPEPKGSCAKSSKSLSGSVAVAQRGECTFIDKAKTAEAGGAAALLITNDDDGQSITSPGRR